GFALEEIQNMNSGCSNDNGVEGYGDFTEMSTELEPGMTYTVEMEAGYSDQDASLWIDLDSDMEFEDEERLITDFNLANSGQVYTKDFTIPEGVTPGEKRLRIRANWQNSSADPCASFSYGETEDYTVVIGGNALNADFTSDVNEVCHGGEIHYYDNSTGNITTWEWEFPGGTPATSNEQNPVVVYNTPGMYGVTLTIGDGTNTSTAAMLEYVIVYDDPQTPDTPTGETEMCQDAPNCTYNTNSAAGATGWIWEMTPETAGTMTNNGPYVEIDWAPDFSGTVQLMVACTNLCGQSNMSDPLDITIIPLPEAAGTIQGTTEVCQEDEEIYQVDVIGEATEYEWVIEPENAGTIAMNQNQCTVTFGNAFEGTASLKVRGLNICGDGEWSSNFDITIEPFPAAAGTIDGLSTVCQEDVVLYTIDDIAAAADYEWTIEPVDAGSLSINQNQCTVTFSSTYEGMAILKVRGINDCGEGEWSDDFTVTIENCVGIGDMIRANAVHIFPNPGKDVFTLEMSMAVDEGSALTVSSVTGKVVLEKQLQAVSPGDQITFELKNVPDGMYFLKLNTSTGMLVKKFLVQQ
ncbi:MAG: GEVED domain-containing protein, partial [Bacteroidota bacterium]